VVAAVSLIKPKKQPKLFSLVFGEGIVNDACSIILFNAVKDFAASGDELNGKAVATIGFDFVQLGIGSLGMGIAFGLACSYLIKTARSLSKNPVAEITMIFSFAYLSYVCAELAHLSGIISLLTSGITMAHYAWYSLSVQGQANSNVVFQFLGFICEGFIFSYLGLTFFSYRYMPFSASLIGLELLIIIVGRGIATMGLIGLLKLCGYEKDHPHPLQWKELVFIWYAGMIRGAIAFGLVLRIDKSNPNRDLIVTTCLSLVLITTIIFGSTVGLLGACLFEGKGKEEV
jgi:sodium/hydrogen exchanger-like protein 6/7/sodium/hydrogen exchanger 8